MLANNTEYGLAAYFYTSDLGRAWRVAEELEYGMVGCVRVVWGRGEGRLRGCCCWVPLCGCRVVGREGVVGAA